MMDLGSVVNQGLIGMQKSQASMAQSAQQIAQLGSSQPAEAPQAGTPQVGVPQSSSQLQDLTGAVVNLKVQGQVFDSSAKVVKAADETLGTLINIRA